MAIWEKFGSREQTLDTSSAGTGTTVDLVYEIDGHDSDTSAMIEAQLGTPFIYNNLARDTITLEQTGPSRWEATVSYRHPNKKTEEEEENGGGDVLEVGDGVFSFDTTGELGHISQTKNVAGETNAYRQRKGHASLSDSPALKGLIGISGDDVEGVDIVMPGLRLTYRTKLPKEFATIQWIKDVASITGTTNNAPFYSFARGELLFLGMQGEQSDRRDPEIVFTFSAASNEESLSFDTINGDVTVSKKGHEYLWLYYGQDEDTTANKLLPRPIDAYVNQVYDESDFSVLGIGTE